MDKNQLELTNVIINYTDTFINKLKLQRDMIDKTIIKLTKQKQLKLQHRLDEWGIPVSDPFDFARSK